MNSARGPDADRAPPAAEPVCSVEEVRRQIRQIEHGLTKVLFGDYKAVITLEGADPMWGNLAMHVNVVINAVRNAIERAERSEREAAVARDRAIAAADAESNFLTNVTHELRTPLASIRASAEILRDYGTSDPEAAREFLAIMVSESERLSRLIENVLDLGRLQSGAATWTPRPTDLATLVGEAVAALQPLARNVQTRIELTVDGPLPSLQADADGIKQVLVNLIGNALKFSKFGDTVAVATRFDTASQCFAIEVRDQGPGIPQDQLGVIFERFRQVTNNILTSKPKGSGLGLAIAKAIVDQHQGRIEVESALGVGSLFRVVLPMHRCASAP